MNKCNSFVFYRSFRAAMEGLLPSEYQMFMNAIVVYGLDRTLPDLPPDLSAFSMMIATLNLRRIGLNGSVGRPGKEVHDEPRYDGLLPFIP